MTFAGRQYSVPLRWVGQWLTLRAFAEEIQVWSSSSCVARHQRAFGPGEPVTDFWHYLPVLQLDQRAVCLDPGIVEIRCTTDHLYDAVSKNDTPGRKSLPRRIRGLSESQALCSKTSRPSPLTNRRTRIATLSESPL